MDVIGRHAGKARRGRSGAIEEPVRIVIRRPRHGWIAGLLSVPAPFARDAAWSFVLLAVNGALFVPQQPFRMLIRRRFVNEARPRLRERMVRDFG